MRTVGVLYDLRLLYAHLTRTVILYKVGQAFAWRTLGVLYAYSMRTVSALQVYLGVRWAYSRRTLGV